MKLSRFKVDKYIVIPLLAFIIISLIAINSATTMLDKPNENLVLKQLIWYTLGFGLIFIIMTIKNETIYKYAWILY